MRVLILNHNLPERGTYFRARRVAEGLHARGHEVTFVCSGNGWYRSRTRERGERWKHWESPSWAPLHFEEGLSPLGLLARALRLRRKWDLVYTFSHFPVDQWTVKLLGRHAHFWMTDWCDLWNSREGGLHDWRLWSRPLPPWTEGWRGKLTQASYRLDDRLEASAARQADAVSIIASPMRRWTRRLGVDDSRVLHLVSGADTQGITPQDRDYCREKIGLGKVRHCAGYVANVSPDNRQLEKALRMVWDAEPGLVLISVGPRWFESDGPMAPYLRSGQLVDFGRQPFRDIPFYMGAADFLVMPARDVPFNQCRWPNKFGDYMAASRATATTAVGDMGRVVRRYKIGVAGSPSPDGLADAMLKLAHDPQMRFACGANARRTAETAFSWDRKIHRLVKFLHSRGVQV
jgi:glycosyltransferase involved in cell wall biosynthesis